ncbi:50S ribosomal protein L21 [Natranaerobius thermophilus]|uniref:Large ribosomal subunit protein bL21 n=1 Tax=Natranaerobius thermophilus (strain ATCC BAA-1301 / DSM 18059 / JW/NM-WN-LF) TaxID=457570 RepID=RL21_NATTJ|nr:50S ribosomal protein L21 [Natranaerobius thermophilus]B2A6B3.1 RecName: Full=Large ribosomal subunit protein bL21; AltName: Full=50S ribosomal protein L21 [Natranaerobius thermophilus JW/NM-WN-LF]ACB84124.1 LSU ribosomal protein L21P [Natranaerobius thermophilus JW/NM-WN-LF]
MYAVIETGGKQYKVSEGDVLEIEKLSQETEEQVTFDKVLLVKDDENVKVGTPVLEEAQVEGTVLEHGKGEKVTVFKYKPKKNYRRKQGHRQPFSKVKIDKIKLNG